MSESLVISNEITFESVFDSLCLSYDSDIRKLIIFNSTVIGNLSDNTILLSADTRTSRQRPPWGQRKMAVE